MPFEEKMTWVSLVVAVLVPVGYVVVMLGRLGETSAAEVSYKWPLLIALGASVILSIVGAIVAAVGTAISAEIRGRSVSDEVDRKDERDKQISRHGDLVGFYVSSVGLVGVLALTMLESEYFWIASALYLSFAIGALVGSVVKLVSYHRGF